MTTNSRHNEFAMRIEKALSLHPEAPPGHGRNTWLQQKLALQGLAVSLETIRKWLVGEALPRPSKMGAIAQALRVDAAWLEVGVDLAQNSQPDDAIAHLREALETILQLSDDVQVNLIARKALAKSQS